MVTDEVITDQYSGRIMTVILLYQCAVDYVCTYKQLYTEKQCLNLSSESSSVKHLSGFSSVYFVTDKENFSDTDPKCLSGCSLERTGSGQPMAFLIYLQKTILRARQLSAFLMASGWYVWGYPYPFLSIATLDTNEGWTQMFYPFWFKYVRKYRPVNSNLPFVVFLASFFCTCIFNVIMSSYWLWVLGITLILTNRGFTLSYSIPNSKQIDDLQIISSYFSLQFKYMIFHTVYSLVFFTSYKYIMNSKSDQLPAGLIAQLVEHCTSHRFESHSGLNFFRLQFHNCLSCVFVFCRSFSYYGPGAGNKTEKLSIDARQSLKGLHNNNTMWFNHFYFSCLWPSKCHVINYY